MNTEITKINDIMKPRGWIFYDAACNSCVHGQRRTGRLFESRGFEWLPLQTPGAEERLGVSRLAFEIRMHLLLADGRVFNNADAFGILCRSVWWLWPIGALLLVPGFRELGRLIYDWFARNRYRFGGTCAIDPSTGNSQIWKHPAHTAPHKWHLIHVAPLLLLPVLVPAFGAQLPAWAFMWALAFALFAGCKWLTYAMAIDRGVRTGLGRSLGYLFAWIGMDANEFLRADKRPAKPGFAEWFSAVANTLLGAALLWIVARRMLPLNPLAAGWTGMIGIVLILHFGLFQILSLSWRTNGVAATPLMRTPIAATSLAEFWGRRWNTAFHELVHRFTFRPLCRRTGASYATLIVFAISGLVHELLISVPARGGFGLPTAYFLIQGLGIVGEHTATGRRMGLGRGLRGRLFTIAVTAVPVMLLLHPPFVHNVILPMLNVIGAT